MVFAERWETIRLLNCCLKVLRSCRPENLGKEKWHTNIFKHPKSVRALTHHWLREQKLPPSLSKLLNNSKTAALFAAVFCISPRMSIRYLWKFEGNRLEFLNCIDIYILRYYKYISISVEKCKMLGNSLNIELLRKLQITNSKYK